MNLISVLIPVHNCKKYIRKTINSLEKQTNKNFNIIFLDDFSTDNTREIIAEYIKSNPNAILLKNSKNMGLSYNRNKLIKSCKTPYFVFLDDDDQLRKNCIETYYNILKKHPNLEIITSNARLVLQRGIFRLFWNHIPVGQKKTNKGNAIDYITTNTAENWQHLISKKYFEKVNHWYLSGVLFEDNGTVPYVIACCKKWYFLKDWTMKYFRRSGRKDNIMAKNKLAAKYKFTLECAYKQMKYSCDAFLSGRILSKKQGKEVLQHTLYNLLVFIVAFNYKPKNQEFINIVNKIKKMYQEYSLALPKPNAMYKRIYYKKIMKTFFKK